MARIGTPNLNLGTWLDNENPGAGAQNADSNGLNGNWIKLDNAFANINPDGSLKASVVDGVNLKSTCVDGSTIVQNGGTKKLEVPAGGIQLANLNANVADGVYIQLGGYGLTLKALSITAAEIANHTIGATQIDTLSAYRVNDGATIGINGSSQLCVNPNGILASNLEEQVYIALITQSGASVPVATVIRNTFAAGAIFMGRVTAGDYTATLAGAFTVSKTKATLSFGDQATGLGSCIRTFASRTNSNVVTFGVDDGTNTHDGFLSNAILEIRVYP